MRMTLAKKGLLLVGIPLLFELVSVSCLKLLIDQFDTLSQAESGDRAVISELVDLNGLFLSAGQSCIGSSLTGNTALLNDYESEKYQIRKAFADLEIHCSLSRKDLSILEQLHHKSDSLLMVLDRVVHENRIKDGLTAQSTDRFGSADWVAFKSLVDENYQPLEATLKEFVRLKKISHEVQVASLEETKNWMGKLLGTLLTLSITISAGVSMLFTLGITRRVAILAKNSSMLANGAPPMPLIGGSDEIAQFDRDFHYMADCLREAQQRRQEFISMISHDIRSPLTSLQFLIGMLVEGLGGEQSPKSISILSRSEHNLQSVISLINQLLDVDRIEAGMLDLNKLSTDLDGIILAAIESTSMLAEKEGIKLITESQAISVTVDEERIRQVLVNLLTNAIKFSSAGQTITVRTNFIFETEEAEVRVIDEGRGIPADQIERVFDKFSQVEKSDATKMSGSGLGLFLCKKLIEAHDGRIGAKKDGGSGCTFWFRLPRATVN